MEYNFENLLQYSLAIALDNGKFALFVVKNNLFQDNCVSGKVVDYEMNILFVSFCTFFF